MTPLFRERLRARCAGLLLFSFAVLAAGCGRPPDGAWLRFLGFSDADGSATTTTASTTVLAGELRDAKALTAFANFENRSMNVAQTAGTGVLVYRVRIEYRREKHAPPPVEYDCTLYLPPPSTEKAATTGSLQASLVPSSVKQWLIDTGAFESALTSPVVELAARVTFFAETNEGLALEAAGSIWIELTNAGATPK